MGGDHEPRSWTAILSLIQHCTRDACRMLTASADQHGHLTDQYSCAELPWWSDRNVVSITLTDYCYCYDYGSFSIRLPRESEALFSLFLEESTALREPPSVALVTYRFGLIVTHSEPTHQAMSMASRTHFRRPRLGEWQVHGCLRW